MGLLTDRFREAMRASKDPRMNEAVFDVMYPTGFYPFDYLNGYKVYVEPITGKAYAYDSVGIVDGSSTMFIGRSGCGKTSFAIQAAANIIRPFPGSAIFFDDIEGGSNFARRKTLTQFNDNELNNRIVYRNAAVSAENFYSRIYDIYNEKISHVSDYEYDTGLLDTNGDPIYKLYPTVYILDSIAMLTPDKITEEEELSGQMSTTASAKTNAAVFRRIVPKLKAAGIILFSVNHINQKVEINPFAKSKAQISWLKQDETLPGGNTILYLANNIVRLDDSTKLKESDGLGVYGKIVDFTLVKSRTNASGRSVPMLFDYINGFDPMLSIFTYLKSIGAIDAKGVMPGTDIKYNQGNFQEKILNNPEFATAFSEIARANLINLLGKEDANIQNKKSSMGIIDNILNPMNGNTFKVFN